MSSTVLLFQGADRKGTVCQGLQEGKGTRQGEDDEQIEGGGRQRPPLHTKHGTRFPLTSQWDKEVTLSKESPQL